MRLETEQPPARGSWVTTPATSTVKTQPICHQLTAAKFMTGTVVILLSNLFERMRHMGSSLKRAGCDSPAPF
jgi:hypothetical protein